jgi:hypothetical protein
MPLRSEVLSSLPHLANDQVSCAGDGFNVRLSGCTLIGIRKCQKSATLVTRRFVVLLGGLGSLSLAVDFDVT